MGLDHLSVKEAIEKLEPPVPWQMSMRWVEIGLGEISKILELEMDKMGFLATMPLKNLFRFRDQYGKLWLLKKALKDFNTDHLIPAFRLMGQILPVQEALVYAVYFCHPYVARQFFEQGADAKDPKVERVREMHCSKSSMETEFEMAISES